MTTTITALSLHTLNIEYNEDTSFVSDMDKDEAQELLEDGILEVALYETQKICPHHFADVLSENEQQALDTALNLALHFLCIADKRLNERAAADETAE